ncbi:pyruvate dehydrogenase (acetyl-transferring) E1 component subunit alpha [Gammaproteobacteria bacterium 45_16_T64]|nr:pyruvate dehydrogenase (acetyl-transferring) E1 component subunit alpha [Gammaproteobacteria bacterium 45_16_T64]
MKINAEYQYIDETGQAKHTFPDNITQKQLLEFYSSLVLVRTYDKKAVALQRTGQLGTYAACLGQEAISLGIGFAMTKQDILVPYYRDQGAQYLRGATFTSQLRYWGGDERGNAFLEQQHTPNFCANEDFPNCVPIATQVTHAAGIASAFKIKNEKRAVVVTCGEGATSRGDFYEPLNLAGVWQLPLVVVVNNNQWAISTPSTMQTHAQGIAEKSAAAGIEGIRVDGNDIIAVHHVVQQALAKAYQGKGGTLIEAMSYRLCDHTTADDATRYRSSDEVNAAWKRDPIKRLQQYLFDQGLWSPEQEQALIKKHQAFIENEVATYLATDEAPVADLFDYLYEELPYPLREQRDHLIHKANTLSTMRN